MSLFRFSHDTKSHPIAHPLQPAHGGFARFLTDEVTSEDYADLLLTCVEEAKKTGKPVVNTGNAFVSTVGPASVSIRHLHDHHFVTITVSLTEFEHSITEWKAFLLKP